MLFDTYKGLTHRAKPFSLKQSRYPINDSINHTGYRTVDDHRPSDGEHLGADTEDEPLRFKLLRGGGHGVGKSRDGDQRARARVFSDVVVDVQRREQHAECDERQRSAQACGFVVVSVPCGEIDDDLRECAQRAADRERPRAILEKRRFRRVPFGERLVFPIGHFHLRNTSTVVCRGACEVCVKFSLRSVKMCGILSFV